MDYKLISPPMPANSAKIPKKAMPKKFAGKSTKKGMGGAFAYEKAKVAGEYEKKGKSPEVAKKIAGAVAAKQGIAKYGKKEMTKMAVAGKKRATKVKK